MCPRAVAVISTVAFRGVMADVEIAICDMCMSEVQMLAYEEIVHCVLRVASPCLYESQLTSSMVVKASHFFLLDFVCLEVSLSV